MADPPASGERVKVRVEGAAAARLAPELSAAGVAVDPDAPGLVHVTLDPPAVARAEGADRRGVEGIEDVLAAWISDARRAAGSGGDVVTVVADALLDGADAAGCAVGHGLVSATRAYAMERERSGEVANVVVADPDRLSAAAATIAWLLRDRVVSGEVLHTGARPHGRQRP